MSRPSDRLAEIVLIAMLLIGALAAAAAVFLALSPFVITAIRFIQSL